MDYRTTMLHEFLTSNRNELITRCRAKVAKRFEPTETPSVVDHGVPLFLEQLVNTLRLEQLTPVRGSGEPEPAPAFSEIGRAAASHGAELLRLGYSIDQVVHEYGDVCQSLTDMAVEQNALIYTDEFRTLNRCLDNAIADAVTAFGNTRQTAIIGEVETLQTQMRAFADEHRRLADIAIQSYSAIKTGNIGLTGATGKLLIHALNELRSLPERTLSGGRPARTPTILTSQ